MSRYLFIAPLAFLFLFCACTTTTVFETYTEIIYESASGLFHFEQGKHKPFPPADAVKAMRKAGIPLGQEIRINIRNHDNQRIGQEVYELLINGGVKGNTNKYKYKRVNIWTDQVGTSQGNLPRKPAW